MKVKHGTGVEAYLRRWLSEFLPKKYGVTSGYIIPNIYDDTTKLYHYDLIIYNALDSPVLWTEGTVDDSEQGRFRAIPAEHVLQIYEVKSRFTKKSIYESVEKLKKPSDYQDQLNPRYKCGVIFIELKEKDNKNKKIVESMLGFQNVFGFYGGLVLRYEGDDSCTGLIDFRPYHIDTNTDIDKCVPIAKSMDKLNIYVDENDKLQFAQGRGGVKIVRASLDSPYYVAKQFVLGLNRDDVTVYLSWSRSNFADFCINILDLLSGTEREKGNVPAFGQVFDLAFGGKIEVVGKQTK